MWPDQILQQKVLSLSLPLPLISPALNGIPLCIDVRTGHSAKWEWELYQPFHEAEQWAFFVLKGGRCAAIVCRNVRRYNEIMLEKNFFGEKKLHGCVRCDLWLKVEVFDTMKGAFSCFKMVNKVSVATGWMHPEKSWRVEYRAPLQIRSKFVCERRGGKKSILLLWSINVNRNFNQLPSLCMMSENDRTFTPNLMPWLTRPLGRDVKLLYMWDYHLKILPAFISTSHWVKSRWIHRVAVSLKSPRWRTCAKHFHLFVVSVWVNRNTVVH